MAATALDARMDCRAPLHPLRAVLMAGSVSLFLGVLMSDIAYANSDQVQWKNFASWLNAGALLLSGLALLWSVVALINANRHRRSTVYSSASTVAGTAARRSDTRSSSFRFAAVAGQAHPSMSSPASWARTARPAAGRSA